MICEGCKEKWEQLTIKGFNVTTEPGPPITRESFERGLERRRKRRELRAEIENGTVCHECLEPIEKAA